MSKLADSLAVLRETEYRKLFLGQAGWREFTSHTWLWVMVGGTSIFLMAIDGPIQVLGPIVARDVYDGVRT